MVTIRIEAGVAVGHVGASLRWDFDAGRLDDAEAKAREAIALAHEVLRPDHRTAASEAPC